MNDDIAACRAALEQGETVWLLRKENYAVDRVRAVWDGQDLRYEFVTGAGSPTYIADLTVGSTPVKPHFYPDPRKSMNPDLDQLIELLIRSDYRSWTTQKSEIEKLG